MATIINTTKIGNTINLSINGILHKTTCKSNDDAKELFSFILKVKENPTPELINELMGKFSIKIRRSLEYGLEYDPNTDEYYLDDFNVPVPETLVEVIKEYHDEGYPKEPILNFWRLLMLNVDKRVRNDLFKFIQTYNLVLTDTGYLVTYKYVRINNMNNVDSKLKTFVYDQHNRIKKVWKRSPKKYVVYIQNDAREVFYLTEQKNASKWNLKEKNITIIGVLDELHNEFKINEEYNTTDETLYTDNYTKKMRIKLGVPVKMNRKDCNGDPSVDCSTGLHVGGTSYVEDYGSWNGCGDSAVLVCLVNPAHVVAVPKYDVSKIRVSEYFPIGRVKFENGKIEHIEQKYFENDYSHYEQDDLIKKLEELKSIEGVKEIEPLSINDTEYIDFPSIDEYKKLIESRIVELK